MSTFTDRLKAEIKNKGIMQKVFLMDLGLNINAIGDWAKRGNIPSGAVLQKIADYFGVTTDWLTGQSQFRTQKALADGLSSWQIGGTDDFDPPYDFCDLIKVLRESQGISIEEFAAEMGLTPEQYELCEEGMDPITWEQAVKLSEYFSTTPRQLMFDNDVYVTDQPVPDDYRHRIDEWERLRDFAEREAHEEAQLNSAVESALVTKPYVKKIVGRVLPLSDEEQKKAWEILKTVFGADDEQP